MKIKGIRFLHSIQVLRGLAVLMVVFYHVYLIGGDKNYQGYKVFESFSEPGKFGVNLFFVLSGFIIFHAHSSDIGQRRQISGYLFKRFSRIYPVYWFFLICYVTAAYIGIGHADFSWEPYNLISAFLLWGGDEISFPLKVAWTLCYELLFYGLFVFFLFSKKIGVLFTVVWLLAIFTTNILFEGAVGVRVLEMWNLNFILGGFSFYIFNKIDNVRTEVILSLIIFSLVGIFLSAMKMDFSETPLHQGNKQVQLILSFSLFLLVVSVLFLNDFFKKSFFRWLVKVGDASYSIYLTHSACISLFYITLRKFNFLSPIYSHGVLAYLAAVFISVIIGYIAFLCVEKPIVNICRRFYDTRQRRN